MRPAVKALIVVDKSVLLIKEERDTGETFWTLPGGGVEEDETHTKALERELKEEIGLSPRDIVLGDYITNCLYKHKTIEAVSRYYLYEVSIPFSSEIETSETNIRKAEWKDISELPNNTLEPIKSKIKSIYLSKDREEISTKMG